MQLTGNSPPDRDFFRQPAREISPFYTGPARHAGWSKKTVNQDDVSGLPSVLLPTAGAQSRHPDLTFFDFPRPAARAARASKRDFRRTGPARSPAKTQPRFTGGIASRKRAV